MTAFVVVLCLSWVLVAGAIGGSLSYFVAWLAGSPSILSYVAGAMAAFVIVWVTCPAGAALVWFFDPVHRGDLSRSAAAVLMAVIVPVFCAQVVLGFSIAAAVAGGFLFHWYQPATAAILIATVFPLAGLVTGALAGSGGGGVSL